jgi:hypothetical protein
MKLIDVTLVSDTAILADGDVICDTAEIPNVSEWSNRGVILDSIVLLDEDDQGIALDLVFLRADVAIGAKNAAPNVSDGNARNIIGFVSVATGDYIDLGGARVATKADIGLILSPLAGTSLYVSAISRGGTPTYSASGLRLRLGFRDA